MITKCAPANRFGAESRQRNSPLLSAPANVRRQARLAQCQPKRRPAMKRLRNSLHCALWRTPGVIPSAASLVAPAPAPFLRADLTATPYRRDRNPNKVPPLTRTHHCQQLRDAVRNSHLHKLPRRARYVSGSRSRCVYPNGSKRCASARGVRRMNGSKTAG